MTLLDTNVLVRYTSPADPAYTLAGAVVQHLMDTGEDLCVVPQSLYEYWVVATRPAANNGLGQSPAECAANVDRFLGAFHFFPDTQDVFTAWNALVRAHQCRGKVAHDARFVAAMAVHHIDTLLTFNVADFTRYPGITVRDPAAVAAALPP
ncbi:MAG: hypothetical protein K2P78_08305 [Gemmataceae bacterium]|nr:hypothetical protein [Gemmataceae bacterium]